MTGDLRLALAAMRGSPYIGGQRERFRDGARARSADCVQRRGRSGLGVKFS